MSYRKALDNLGSLLLMAIIQSLICGTVGHIRLDGLAYSNIWVFFFLFFVQLLSSLMEWQHLVGVVQRSQPCLHDHPVCGAV